MRKLKAKVNNYYKKIESLKSELEELRVILDNALKERDEFIINRTCEEIKDTVANISKEMEAVEDLLPEILDAKIKPEEKENLLNKLTEVSESVNLFPTSQSLLDARLAVSDESVYISREPIDRRSPETAKRTKRQLDAISGAREEASSCNARITHVIGVINTAKSSSTAKEFSSKAYPIIY